MAKQSRGVAKAFAEAMGQDRSGRNPYRKLSPTRKAALILEARAQRLPDAVRRRVRGRLDAEAVRDYRRLHHGPCREEPPSAVPALASIQRGAWKAPGA